MWNDLQFAFRTLRRSPGFVCMAILSLALGIGANTAIFSLLYQVVLRSLPVKDPQSLVILQKHGFVFGWTRSDNNGSVFSYPMYRSLRDNNQVFDGLVGRAGYPANLSYRGNAISASAELVTGNLFNMLGVKPLLGRPLLPSDDQPDAQENVVVLGYGFWSNHLGQDPAVLNHRILVNNHPALVVGVARRQFHGLLSGRNPDFYIPLSAVSLFDATLTIQGNQPDHYWLSLFGRLKPGVSSERATAALQPLFHATLTSELPRFKDVSARNRTQILADTVNTKPAAQGLNQLQMQWQAPLLVLMAMVGLVLLMACVNVANLLIARAAGREREFAIRLAVGATKFQVFRQLLVESLLLSVTGGIIGLIVSGALTMGLLSVIPPDTFSGWLSSQINWTLFGFSITLAIMTGVLFGMAPALQAVRPVLAAALREKTSGISAGTSKGRFRQILVAVQVCLSLFLLIGAGLFTRSLVNLLNNDPGFRADQLVTFNINSSLAGYSPARSFTLDRELQNELGAIPGVRSAALANLLPLAGDNIGTGLSANGSADNMISTNENPVGPGYFHTLGIPLVEGREFTLSDTSQSPRVVILNEKFAHELFPKESAMGHHVRIGPQATDTEVVGVVKDSKFDGLRENPKHFMYVPNEQNDLQITGQTVFFLRTGNNEKAVVGAIPTIVKRLDSALPVNNLTTMRGFIDSTIYTDRLMAILAIAFGGLATLLAAVGLYGIISYSVTRRTQEFGIRLALGAERGNIITLVIREIVWLVVIGLVVGLPVSYALALLIQSQLYGIKAYDPVVLIGATLVLIVAAALAGWIPALRAMRIEPTQALRYE